MIDVIKIQYMDKFQRDYSEYVTKTKEILDKITSKEGNIAFLLDGKPLYLFKKVNLGEKGG